MVPVNFNQLYYFWIIAKAGSISAAAKNLLLHQSTLSLQMKQLEASLGKRLAHRGRHGVTLTDEGRAALEHCENMFGQAEELMARLNKSPLASAPRFRLGASESIPHDKILQILKRIQALRPESAVRVFTGSAEELQSRLDRRGLDLAVSDVDLSPRMGRSVRSRLISSTQLFFVASPRLKEKARRFPAGLRNVPLLLRAPNNPVRMDVEYYLRRKGIPLDLRAEVENSDLIRLMAVRGDGVAVMDAGVIDGDLRAGRLARLHDRPVGIRENIWFVCGRHPAARPAVQAVLDELMVRFAFRRAARE